MPPPAAKSQRESRSKLSPNSQICFSGSNHLKKSLKFLPSAEKSVFSFSVHTLLDASLSEERVAKRAFGDRARGCFVAPLPLSRDSDIRAGSFLDSNLPLALATCALGF